MGDSYTEVYDCLRNMALFSEDLFNVFEETEKPSLGKTKKRKRNEQKADNTSAKAQEDLKKAKIDRENDENTAVDDSQPSTSSSMQTEDDKKTTKVLSVAESGDTSSLEGKVSETNPNQDSEM